MKSNTQQFIVDAVLANGIAVKLIRKAYHEAVVKNEHMLSLILLDLSEDGMKIQNKLAQIESLL